jgi:hypothetical protein
MSTLLKWADCAGRIELDILMLLLVGALMVFSLIYSISRKNRLKRHGIQVTGRVTSVKRRFRYGQLAYVATIQYTTMSNEQIQREWISSTRFSKLEPGESVVILYDPNSPERFLLK